MSTIELYDEFSTKVNLLFQSGNLYKNVNTVMGIQKKNHDGSIVITSRSMNNNKLESLTLNNILFNEVYIKKINNVLIKCYKDSIKKNIYFQFSCFLKTSIIHIHNKSKICDDSRKDGLIRLALVSNTGVILYDDITFFDNIDLVCEEIIKCYSKLCFRCKLENEQVKLNTQCQKALFSSKAASFLVHEILGHLFEKDILTTRGTAYNDCIVGNKYFDDSITIISDGRKNELNIGTGNFDDAANESKQVYIVKNGCLQNSIDIERRESYIYNNANRMAYLYLKKNELNISYECMLDKLNSGIIIDNILSAAVMTSNGDFYLNCGLVKVIKNGYVHSYTNNVCIFDNAFNVFRQLYCIGSDFNSYTGNCNKSGQVVRVGMGSPSLLFSKLNIFYGGYSDK